MNPGQDNLSDVADLPLAAPPSAHDTETPGGLGAVSPVATPTAQVPDLSDVADLPLAQSPLADSFQSVPVDNPDEAAKIISLAKQTGENPNFVQANLPAVQAAAAGPTPGQLDQAQRDAPRAAGWLANPNNMAVAHDDLDNLTATERIFQNIQGTANLLLNKGMPTPADVAGEAGKVAKAAGAALGAGMASAQLNLLEFDRMMGLATPETDAAAAQLRARIATLEASRPASGILARGAFGAAEQLPFVGGTMLEGAKYGMPMAMAAAAAGPGSIIAAPVAYGIGAAAGSLWFNFKVLSGQEYARLRDLKDEQGQPLPENVVKVTALVSGAAQAGVSLLPITALLKSIPGGAEFLARMAGQVTPKVIAKLGYGPAILRAVGEWAKHTVQGAAGMAGMTAAAVGGEAAAKAASGQPFEQASPGEAAGQIGQSFLEALPVMGILGLPGTAVKGSMDLLHIRRAILQSDVVKNQYLELGKAVDGSKLAERLPDAHEQVLGEMVKDTPHENIYIPVDAFEQYAQSKKADPLALAEELGIGALYQEAQVGSSDIKIPTAVWASKTRLVAKETGMPVWADLADDVKFSPDGFTPRQAKERSNQMAADIKQEVDAAISSDTTGALEAQRKAIYGQRYQQVRAAGRPDAEAKADAEITANMAIQISRNSRGTMTPGQASQRLISAIHGVGEIVPGEPLPVPDIAAQVEAARGRLYSEVKSEVSRRPEYRAAEYLRQKLGPGFKNLAIKGYEQGKLTPEQRRAFHDAAAEHGLGEGEDLIKLVAEMPTREQAIQAALDTHLASQFGEKLYQATPVVDTPEFKAWFGDSKVVDEEGKPRVVYHGTVKSFNKFSENKLGSKSDHPVSKLGFYFDETSRGAAEYAKGTKGNIMPVYLSINNPYEISASNFIKNWLEYGRESYEKAIEKIKDKFEGTDFQIEFSGWDEFIRNQGDEISREFLPQSLQIALDKFDESKEKYENYDWRDLFDSNELASKVKAFKQTLVKKGYDGIIIHPDFLQGDEWPELQNKQYIAFYPNQIKSVFNRGTFDPNNPNILFQLAKPEAAKSLLDIYAKISDRILDLRTKYTDERFSKALHDQINKQITDFGKIYKMEKESRAFAAWLRDKGNASSLMEANAKEVLYQKMQETFGQGAAGAFDPATRAILLSLKAANRSTFIHESAHAWMKLVGEMVKSGQASEKLAADHKTLADWLGAEKDKPLTVKQQEKFAAAFESYLRDGKAPTPELKSVFRRFRAWLTKIYQSAKDIGAGILGDEGISPEVRAVMDRMLAAEEEAAYAEKRMDYTRPIDLTGLDPKIAARLAELQKQAHDEAVDKLVQKQMAEIAPENQAAIVKRRGELVKQWSETLKAQPEYVLVERMGKLYEGKSYKDVAQKYLDGTLKEDERVAFDLAAAASDYYSGEEMAQELLSTTPLSVEALARANADLKAEFPEFRATEEMQAEATEVIHNEKQMETLALEHEILQAKIQGAKFQANLARAAADAKAAKIKAEEALVGKTVDDIRSPLIYFTNERNCAMQVAKFAERGDFARAAAWKRKQLYNHALGVGVLQLRKQADRTLNHIRKVFMKRRELFKDEETAIQVACLLDRFGFGRRPEYDPAQRKESLASYLQRMEVFFKADEQDTTPYQVPDWIKNSETSRKYGTLNISELSDVRDAIDNIAHVANMQDKFYMLSDKVSIEQMAADMADYADSALGAKIKQKQMQSRMDKAKHFFASGLYSNLQILTFVQWLDGGQADGFWKRTILDPMLDRAEIESRRIDETSKKLAAIMARYSKQERADLFKKKIMVPEFGLDRSNPITKETLIALALNMGNEGNIDRLISKAPEGFDRATFEWSRLNAEEVIATIKTVLGRHLTAKDFEVVQNIWDTLNEFWPEIAAHHKTMTGFTPENVEPSPLDVRLADGTEIHLRGGYYPLKKDPRSGPKAAQQDAAETELSRSESISRIPVTRHSFTEKRTGGTYAVSLQLDRLTRHLTDVIHDLHFREYIVDLRRLISKKTFFDGIKRNLGIEGYNFFKEWVHGVAAGGVSDEMPAMGQAATFFNSALRWMNQNAVMSVVMLSPRIINQNLGNLFLYGRAVKGWTYSDAYRTAFTHGLFNYLPKVMARVATAGTHKAALEMRKFVWEKSQYMKDRANNPEPTIRAYKKVFLGQSKDLNYFGRSLLSWSDDLWNMPQWIGAYEKKLAETGDEKTAVRFADSLIKSAIMPESKYEMAQTLRSNSELTRSFTRLYSFWNAQFNRFLREEGPALKHPIKNAPMLLGFAASQLMFIYASAILSGQGPKEDASDEEKALWFTSQFARNYLSYLPMVRDIAPIALDHILGTGFSGATYRASPGAGAIQRSLDNFVKAVKEAGTGFENGPQAFFEPASQVATFVAPYPAIFNAIFWNAIDWMDGMELEALDLMKRRPKKER